MKIAAYTLQMDAQHAREQKHEIRESVRSSVRRLEPASTPPAQSPLPASTVQISDAARAAQSGAAAAIHQALVDLARDLGIDFDEPEQHDREGWASDIQTAFTALKLEPSETNL